MKLVDFHGLTVPLEKMKNAEYEKKRNDKRHHTANFVLVLQPSEENRLDYTPY